MKAIPEFFAPDASETQISYPMSVIAMICGLGIVVFVCLATLGLDLSDGFF
jgi:hypothetical protein